MWRPRPCGPDFPLPTPQQGARDAGLPHLVDPAAERSAASLPASVRFLDALLAVVRGQGGKVLVMSRFLGWSAAAVVAGALLWQSLAAQPLLPHWLSATLLLMAGLLAGIRIGTGATTTYISDLQRLNKFLVDQNRELENANAMLLDQLTAVELPTTER